MELVVYTDGGSINNPGQAASAYLIYKNKEIIAKGAVRLGIATNNVAEYTALIIALTKINGLVLSYKPTKIICYSDSSLMVNQVNGIFKMKDKNLRNLLIKIRMLEQGINLPIVYKHILREKNQAADTLVKNCLLNSEF